MKIDRKILVFVAMIASLAMQVGCERKTSAGNEETEPQPHRLRANAAHPNYLECDFYDKKFCLLTLSTVQYYEGRKHNPIWLSPGTKVAWMADTDQSFTVSQPIEDPSCETDDAKKGPHKHPFDTDISTSTPVSYLVAHVRNDADKGTCFDINITPTSKTGANTKAIDPHVFVGDGGP